jgi:hypothetical protein
MILGLMIASGGKAYYLTPFYPLLFAAGGVAFERAPGGRWLAVVVPALVLVVGAAVAPLAKPLLSEEAFVPYAAALGQDPRAGIDERHPLGVLPQHFADQHGWPELAARVAEVHRRLSPDERAAACIFTANYGEAAAVDVFGRALGLPSAISGHNTYWLWGPHDCDFSTVIVVGFDAADVRDFVGSVEVAAHVICPYCMPYEQRDVLVTHGLTLPRDALWRRVKHYL